VETAGSGIGADDANIRLGDVSPNHTMNEGIVINHQQRGHSYLPAREAFLIPLLNRVRWVLDRHGSSTLEISTAHGAPSGGQGTRTISCALVLVWHEWWLLRIFRLLERHASEPTF
jgi:hypothetical protein